MSKKRAGGTVQSKNYVHRSIFAKEIPKGIKALLIYSIVMAIFYKFFLFLGFYAPDQIGLDTATFIINVAVFVLLIAFIIAVLYKRPWAYHLAIAWFSISIVLSLVSFAMVRTEFATMRALLIVSAFCMIFVDGLALWYVVRKRQYFTGKVLLRYDDADKTFLYVLGSFWLVLIFVAAGLGLLFYSKSVQVTD